MAENAISCSKQAMKNFLESRRQELRMPTDRQLRGRTLQACRFDTIKDFINSTAVVVTPSKCASLYNHTTKYLSACIVRENIQVNFRNWLISYRFVQFRLSFTTRFISFYF